MVCTSCQNHILNGAKVCQFCGTKTNRVTRAISFSAQIVGFIVVIASAVAYLAGQVEKLHEYITWKPQVKVLTLDPKSISIANVGDGNVFVDSIEYKVELETMKLESGISLQMDIPFEKVSKEILSEKGASSSQWVKLHTESSKRALIEYSDPYSNTCLVRSLRLTNEPSFKSFENDPITAIVTESKINFYDISRNVLDSHGLEDIVLTFYVSTEKTCEHFTDLIDCMKVAEQEKENIDGRISGCRSNLKKELNKINVNNA